MAKLNRDYDRNIQMEVYNVATGAVIGILPTVRRATNLAVKSEDMTGVSHMVRRMVPMRPSDLFPLSNHPGLARYRCERLQANGFWQPTGYDYHTGRKLYWL